MFHRPLKRSWIAFANSLSKSSEAKWVHPQANQSTGTIPEHLCDLPCPKVNILEFRPSSEVSYRLCVLADGACLTVYSQQTLTKGQRLPQRILTPQTSFLNLWVSRIHGVYQSSILNTDNLKIAEGYFRPQRLPDDVVYTLLSLYPTDPALGCPYNTGDIQLSAGKLDKMACSIFGDLVQIGPARFIAQTLAQDGHQVYRYRFNHLPANTTDVTDGITTGLEQSYVFSNLLPDNPWDQALAYQMSAAWASFAHSLDPNWSKGICSPTSHKK
jgi:hypothetical protein